MEYEYQGCVTGFSEADTITLWQPEQVPYKVDREDNEYSERLLDVLLLEFKGYRAGWWKDPKTGIVYCKNVPEGETHVFEDDPIEYISVYTKEDARKYGQRAATSNITNMNVCFKDAAEFNEDISRWDISNVTDISNMFYRAEAFNQNIGGWDTSNVTQMYNVFCHAHAFNQDISKWDTSNVVNMSNMFQYASVFNQDLSQWCVTKIPDKPFAFDTGARAWKLPKPLWGKCPRGENSV